MSPKKGNNLPHMGKMLPPNEPRSSSEAAYAAMVAAALRKQLGNARGAAKTVSRWTGASPSTVKNWFSGARGPSGMHLIGLIRNSDAVLEGLLRLADREPALAEFALAEARTRLLEMLRLLPQTSPNKAAEP